MAKTPKFVQEDDLILEAAGNAGQAITANVTDIPFIQLSDNTGGWNGSTFTVPKDGIWSIDLSVYFTNLLDRQLVLFKNGVGFKILSPENNSSFHKGDYIGRFDEDDVLSFRVLGNAGTLNSSPSVYHYLSITHKGSLIIDRS